MIKVYGPYVDSNTGRKVVIHYDLTTRTRRTQSYPRFLMEKHLGRKLLPTEQVDHINGDPTDDRIDNFQLLSAAENNRKHFEQKGLKAKRYYFDCPVCGKAASILYRTYKSNQLTKGKAGPYCSRSCAGKAHH